MIKVQAKAKGTAEVLIYGPIGEDWYGNGVTAKKFREQLQALGELDEITIRVNSPGGEVFDGFAIYNELRANKARKVVHIDGLAASISSVIAMAGDEIVMGLGAMMMIHDPWTIALGNSTQMREQADVLDKVKVGLVDAYAAFNGAKDRAEIESLMTAETWFTASEAVDAGFATRLVGDNDETTEQAQARSHRHAFAELRAQLRVAPNSPASAITPAASSATTTKEPTMDPALKEKIEAEARADALRAEAARVSEIRAMFGPHGVQHLALMSDCIADQGCTAQAASTKLLAALAANATPTAGLTHNVLDQRDKFVAGASNAILARLSPKEGGEKLTANNEFAGMGLKALIRVSLRNAGVSGADRLDGANLAAKFLASHSTSDFPYMLANTAAKVLKAAYENAPTTWQLWAPVMSVSDFKSTSVVTLSAFSDLADKAEGAEYTQGTMSEGRETIQAGTKGRYIDLTREAIINDDLGGFLRTNAALGAAAARSVNKAVYTKLYANPTMADTGALFNTTAVTTTGGHANLAGSGGAIAVSTISAGESAMALQKDPSRTQVLNLRPAFLLAPVGKKQIAWDVLNSPTDISQSNSAKRNYAASLGLTMVSDAEMDANSTTAWHLIAGQSTPCIEVAFLDGVQTPYIEEDVSFLTDSMRMKVRLDFGVAATDWRTAYKNGGA